MIAEQTEQIEKLNEADNVLKLNAELKKQNEKLKQDKLNAEQEAEATVSSVKREYEAKGIEKIVEPPAPKRSKGWEMEL